MSVGRGRGGVGPAYIWVLEAAVVPDRSVTDGVAWTGAAMLGVAAPVTVSSGDPGGTGGI